MSRILNIFLEGFEDKIDSSDLDHQCICAYESLGDLLIFFGGSCHSLMALQIPKGGGFVTFFFFLNFV